MGGLTGFFVTVLEAGMKGMQSIENCMGNLTYVFYGVLVGISVLSVIFCIVYGKGASHKTLVFFVSMLGVVVTVCFGGEAALNLFGMGWRCTPVNLMLMLCAVFFIAALLCCMAEFIHIENASSVLMGCGFISMLLVIFLTLILAYLYFSLASWHDGLTTYDNQTIVYANDMHGGSCSWRYYNHINSLVHGVEIIQAGWHGNPPRSFYS